MENQTSGRVVTADDRSERKRPGGWRLVVATILAVAAALAVPLAVATSWTRTLVNDTDSFMHTYSPVLDTQAMQQVITDELTTAIIDHLGVADDGIARQAVSLTVSQAIATDTVRGAKETSLRLLHGELRALLNDQPGNIGVEDGRVELRFEPFASLLRERLADAGVPFVDRLPQITGGVTLFTIDPQIVPNVQQGMRGVDRAATILPWAVAILLIGALVTAPRRSWVLTIFGLSVALSVLAVGFGWDFGVEYWVSRLDGALAQVAQTVAERTSEPIAKSLEMIAIGGVVVSIAAAVAGRRWRF